MRKLNLKTVNVGDIITDGVSGNAKFVGFADKNSDSGRFCSFILKWRESEYSTYSVVEFNRGEYTLYENALCLIEGQSIYKGDRVYGTWFGSNPMGYIANRVENDILKMDECSEWPIHGNGSGKLTLKKPKVKKTGWLNVYPNQEVCSFYYEDEETAKRKASRSVIATVKIEWEE